MADHPRSGVPPADDAALVDHLLAQRDHERQVLAGRLHDGPQQTTTALRLLADSARHALDEGNPGQARSALERVEQLALEASEQLRRLSAGLDPVVLERRGPLQALAALPEALHHEYGVEAQYSGPAELPQTATPRDMAAYAIAREFAGEAIERGARAVSIALDLAGGALRLRVDARGAAEPSHGAALLLARRAAGMGAAITIEPRGNALSLVLTAP